MIRVGITGGIGSGKSLMSQVFERLGVPVFYADDRAKWLYDHDGQVREQLINHFGPEIYGEQGLKRTELASRIFRDPEALKTVNRIVHPRVRDKFEEWCRQQTQQSYVLEEAAILFETGADRELDQTILVYAPKDLRIKRVMERDGVARQAVLDRMKYQLDDEEKISRAGFIIYNDGSCMVIPQILDIHKRLIRK